VPQPPDRAGKQIQAVIFDFDDTLIDWSGQEIHGAEIGQRHLRNVFNYLVEQGFDLLDEELFYDIFGQIILRRWQEAKVNWDGVAFQAVMAETLQTCGLDLNEIDMAEVLRVYDWQPVPGVRPFPDTLPVLQTLKEQGYKIGLVTNAMQPMWMRDVELHNYGLLDYLDARITSGDTGYMKPHPQIYERILALLEVDARHALFVGDRPENDIAGANDAGILSVLISPPHLNYDLNGVRPDFTIARLNELLPILAEIEDTDDKNR